MLGESGIVSEDSSWGWQVTRAGVSYYLKYKASNIKHQYYIVHSKPPRAEDPGLGNQLSSSSARVTASEVAAKWADKQFIPSSEDVESAVTLGG